MWLNSYRKTGGVDIVKVLEIHGSTGDSTILIGESLGHLRKYIPAEEAVIITDANVRHYYL